MSDINADQITAWNDTTGKTWVKMNPGLDRQLEPIGKEMLAHADLAPGLAVLDIGCGGGATSLEAARSVAPGKVLGVDISAPLLELARGRAEGLDNLQFLEADAQTYGFEAKAFDRVVSRFGVMFFADPTAAFVNIRRACKPDALLSFACWRSMQDNPWLTLPLEVASHLVPPRPPVGDPFAPGPTAFADPRRVKDVLGGSGWREVQIEPLDMPVGGGDLEDTTALLTRVGPLGHAIREAGASRELIDAASDAVREAVRRYLRPDGTAWMPSATWIVTARA